MDEHTNTEEGVSRRNVPQECIDYCRANGLKNGTEIEDLSSLVGRRVRALTEFPGIPKGTDGVVDEHYRIGGNHEGVMVRWGPPVQPWDRTRGALRDGFGRDSEFDELVYLAVVDG